MTSSDRHEATHALIPLYLNGALHDAERASFENRMRDDAALRREYEEFLEIEQAFRESEARDPVDLDAVLRTTLARVRQETVATSPRTPSHSLPRLRGRARVGAFMRRFLGEPRLAWAVIAAQLAVIAVLVAYLPSGGEVAQTLSGTDSIAHAGPRINVVFAERATQREVRELLGTLRARIGDGPTRAGVVTIEIPDRHADVDAALAVLRASGIVVFAEPAY